MLKNKFELPALILPPIEEVIERLSIFPGVTAKKHYLDRAINNYQIEEALRLWDKDCAECVRQGHENRASWLGIFHAVFGDPSNPFDQQKDPAKFEYYNLGQRIYNDYLQLCELRNNLTSEAIKVVDYNASLSPGLTLQTKYDPEQLKKLRKALLEGKYITDIKEDVFVYLLSGKALNNMPKIKWKKSKNEAVYLLDNICIEFYFSTANNCIETFSKGLDSNNRKNKYHEIDNILKTLRPM